ncbi:MAG: MobF family relaxase [Cyclobacteriaceae bacterium]
MIRMFQSQTSAQAKSYFRDALSKADYYIADQELNGRFHGQVAQRLGLDDQMVDREVFDKLCDNINPRTDMELTPRKVKDRRVGYDMSFHAPKSVSILHALGKDDRVVEAFRGAVYETMQDIEQDLQTRVRRQGQDHDRDTSEILYADFIHQTARPVGNNPPDPHLHCHCFAFNVTYDQAEERFKAGQFHDIKRDMPYHQARFQKRLADRLSNLGYGIRKTRDAFELTMVPEKAVEHFSKRTNLIGQVAKEQNITDPKELDGLGARTRDKKDKGLTMPILRKLWRQGLREAGINEQDKGEAGTRDIHQTPEKTLDYALNHAFTRSSVKSDRQLLSECARFSVDNPGISLSDIDQAFDRDKRITKIPDGKRSLCTTLIVQTEERDMVGLARRFQGSVRPLNPYPSLNHYEGLNDQQIGAINHVLTSPDRLVMIRGGAGTGKTTLIKHAVKAIEEKGKNVYLFAPTAGASRDVLRSEGFDQADTVSRLIKDTDLQSKLTNQVIWVDEAGMLGATDMLALEQIADKQNVRLILSGDPKQHSAVNRGDAMRILNQVARLKYQNVNVIYRQRSTHYREAVKDISDGNIRSGFSKLDAINAIQEIKSDQVVERLSKDYLKALEDKKSALIVSPTNEQSRLVTSAIRSSLRSKRKLGKRERAFTSYRNLYLTEAQKQDPRSYRPGQVIQTHQNMPGIGRGQKLDVVSISADDIRVKDHLGKSHKLDLKNSNRFDVYTSQEITLAKGDLIRVTKNGFDRDGNRVDNGKTLVVTGFNSDNSVRALAQGKPLGNTYTFGEDFGNIDYGYCVTSYSSQGKTVDRVLIAQPAMTFPASNAKQFYVSVSRGRDNVTIYTDDKESLLESVTKPGDRMAALELDQMAVETKAIEHNRVHSQERPKAEEKTPQPFKDIDHDDPKV